MEYKKIKTQIENAVRKFPSDPVPYEDMRSMSAMGRSQSITAAKRETCEKNILKDW